MRPGLTVMRALPLRIKLVGIVLLVFVPLLMLVVQVALRLQDDARVAAAEAEGADVVAASIDVVLQVQTHRGQTNAFKGGDATMGAKLQQTREGLRRATQLLDREVRSRPALQLLPHWTPLAAELARMADGQVPDDAPAAFAWHTGQVAALRRLVHRTAEHSGLLLDPQAASFLLMDIAVERVIPWTELLGLTRGQGAGLLARGSADAGQLASVLGRREQILLMLDDLKERVAALERSGERKPDGFDQALAASNGFADRVQQTFGGGQAQAQGQAADYFAAGTQAIAAVGEFRRTVTQRLQSLLHQRHADAQRQLALTLVVVLCGVGLQVYGMACFYRSFIGAMTAINRNIERSSEGDLTQRVEIHGRDEVAQMGDRLERLNDSLSNIVAYIRSSAALVGEAGASLSGGTRALSERTEQQAASLEQTTASLQEINEAVGRNSRDALDASQLAEQVQHGAEDGSSAVQAAVQRVHAIDEGARRIAEIIGVIDGIAFQTNILALNAAVEAARAGEHGRGFAVVAAEVRQLAQRCAQSAGEVRHLIGQSNEQVAAGVEAIGGVARSFEHIVAGVAELTTKVTSISASSQHQSDGLRQVSQAVSGLDEITQRNAIMVEHHAQAAAQLNDRARQLAQAVANIRLRQGTADEAKALVEQAKALIGQRGLGAARAALEDPQGPFRDRDLYVFVIHRQGHFEVFGADPSRDGQAVTSLPSLDGQQLMRDTFAAADAGGGWVDYDIRQAASGTLQHKQSYVLPLDADRLVGCGVYKPVLAAAPAAATAGA